MRRRIRWAVVAASVLAASAVVSVGGARADGDCGRHDDSGRAACPIRGNGTYSGSLTVAHDPYPYFSERDYFVFHAKADTALHVTVHDDSDPHCDGGDGDTADCGIVSVQLLDTDGTLIAYDHGLGASVQNAVATTATMDHTIRRAGTYDIVILGSLNRIIAGPDASTLLPVPYSFSVSGTPAVFWPPSCTVPRVRRHESLTAAKRGLVDDGCRVGRVARRRDRRLATGDVLGFGARAGRTFPHGTRIGILVARR